MKEKQYETSQKENGHDELNQLSENLAEKSCKERVSETILCETAHNKLRLVALIILKKTGISRKAHRFTTCSEGEYIFKSRSQLGGGAGGL